MTYFNPDSEDAAIEKPTIALFGELGWETLNCYHETFGPLSLLGRETMAEVVLPSRLRAAIESNSATVYLCVLHLRSIGFEHKL